MILRSVRVTNWRKLTTVELPSFSPKITVIYAPNKTGKSSIVEAIRWGLLDCHYDTTLITRIIPWRTNRIPEVTVEFEVNHQRYRLTKRFTKKSGGGAELYQLDAGGTQKLIADGKQVTTGMQQLLEVGKSDQGIAQLLWVRQGEIALPKIDEALDKRLRPVLGTVITGRDAEFRPKLWKKMLEWFTTDENAASGKHKPTSNLKEIEQRIREKESKANEINSKFREIEALLMEVQQREQEKAIAEPDVASAAIEVERLRREDIELTEKRQRAIELKTDVGIYLQELSNLEKALDKHRENASALRNARQALMDKEEESAPLRQAVEAAATTLEAASQKRDHLEKEIQKFGTRRAKIDSMRRLLQIQEDIQSAESTIRKVEQKEKSIHGTEKELAELLAPEEKEIERTKVLVDQMVELNVKLKAGELSLTITPKRTGAVILQIDRENKETVALTPGGIVARSVRQRIWLDADDFGTVEIARGKEDETVEGLALKRATLEQQLSRTLTPWGLQYLDRSDVIPELTRRATQRTELKKRLEGYEHELSELAPEGIAEFREVIGKGDIERGNTLQAHPDLNSWIPSRKSMEQASTDFEKEEAKQKEAIRIAKQKEEQAKADLKRSEDKAREIELEISSLKIDLARKETLYTSHEKEWGAEIDLINAIAAQKLRVKVSQNDFDKHRLTEDEERVPERLEEARQALARREKRLNELRESLAGLIGQLNREEGLHAERIAAEQTLESANRAYKQVTLEVDTHRMLLMLFDEIRDENVEKSIGPVRELVDRWLGELDGVGHPEVTFNTDLQVNGLRIQGDSSLSVEESTSYGEREQLATLVRLAYGAVLAKEEDEPQVVILDDPFAHSDPFRHRKMLEITEEAAGKNLQIVILTCHPNRFDHLKDAVFFNLAGNLEALKAG